MSVDVIRARVETERLYCFFLIRSVCAACLMHARPCISCFLIKIGGLLGVEIKKFKVNRF